MLVFEVQTLRRGTLNKYIDAERSHRNKGAKLKKSLTAYCALVVRRAMVKGEAFNWPSNVVFRWFLPDARIDPDNWAFTQKYVFDGMQDARLGSRVFLVNDSLKYIKSIKHEYYKDKERPRLEVFEVD